VGTSISRWTIEQVAAAIRSGIVSSTSVTELMLRRIERLDGELRSFSHVAADFARESAERADRELGRGLDRGLLHGVPIGLKDIFFNPVMPISAGMASVPPSWRTPSSTVFDRVVRAGAVVLGTLVTAEGAHSGYRPGTRPPINPWGPSWWSGTSSSGSAVATAAGLCFGAYGSDTGGSIRFPASACGVTGLKPTWGRISRYGVTPNSPSLDHVGPFARTARDTQILVSAVEGRDDRDPTSSSAEPSAAAPSLRSHELVVGIDPQFADPLAPDIERGYRALVSTLESLGAAVVEVSFPDPEIAARSWTLIDSFEIAKAHGSWFRAEREAYGAELVSLIETGLRQDPNDVARAYAFQQSYRAASAAFYDEVDIFVCPVHAGPLPTAKEWMAASGEHLGFTKFTAPFNLAGTPTITIPVGLDDRGVPMGGQLCAGAFREGLLTQVASAVQRATAWHLATPSTEDAVAT